MICSSSIFVLKFYRLQRTTHTPTHPAHPHRIGNQSYYQGFGPLEGPACKPACCCPTRRQEELEELKCQAMPSPISIPMPRHAMPAAFSPTLTDV
jgi:hypothetical protein